MQPSDLDLYTTQELIDELMRRNTFLGVVVHAEREFKGQTWKGEKIFKVHVNRNLKPGQAGRLLDVIGERMLRPEV